MSFHLMHVGLKRFYQNYLLSFLQPLTKQDLKGRSHCTRWSSASESEPSDIKVSPDIHVLFLQSCILRTCILLLVRNFHASARMATEIATQLPCSEAYLPIAACCHGVIPLGFHMSHFSQSRQHLESVQALSSGASAFHSVKAVVSQVGALQTGLLVGSAKFLCQPP